MRHTFLIPRVARIVVEGAVHHGTQRGNRRQDVFFADDRRADLGFLKKACAEHGVTVQGYCLMSNHVQVIAVPKTEPDLARAI